MSKKKEPPKESAKVIKGPWPNSGVKISEVDGVRLIEELAFADHLTEGIMVNVVDSMQENEIDVRSQEFLADIGFVIEAVKAVIYRSMNHGHPLHEVMGNTIKVTEVDDGEESHFDTIMDIEILESVNDFITANLEDEDDEPEISWTI